MMTITEMKALNKDNGFFFFERATLRFFKSKIESQANDKGHFVTSEQFDNEARLYTIRHICENGDVDTVGKFQGYKSRKEALEARRAL